MKPKLGAIEVPRHFKGVWTSFYFEKSAMFRFFFLERSTSLLQVLRLKLWSWAVLGCRKLWTQRTEWSWVKCRFPRPGCLSPWILSSGGWNHIHWWWVRKVYHPRNETCLKGRPTFIVTHQTGLVYSQTTLRNVHQNVLSESRLWGEKFSVINSGLSISFQATIASTARSLSALDTLVLEPPITMWVGTNVESPSQGSGNHRMGLLQVHPSSLCD